MNLASCKCSVTRELAFLYLFSLDYKHLKNMRLIWKIHNILNYTYISFQLQFLSNILHFFPVYFVHVLLQTKYVVNVYVQNMACDTVFTSTNAFTPSFECMHNGLRAMRIFTRACPAIKLIIVESDMYRTATQYFTVNK